MSKKRIMTIVNILLSVIIIGSIFLPIVGGKALFNSNSTAKYFIFILCIVSIIVNILDKKVEFGLITSGFVFFYLIQYGWGLFGILEYGYYIMLISSFVLMTLTIIYGFIGNKKNKDNVKSQLRNNNNVMNGYPNRGQMNNQMPYPGQMVYRNGQSQMYSNYNKR